MTLWEAAADDLARLVAGAHAVLDERERAAREAREARIALWVDQVREVAA
jgi:hypothetical protein